MPSEEEKEDEVFNGCPKGGVVYLLKFESKLASKQLFVLSLAVLRCYAGARSTANQDRLIELVGC